MMRGHLFLAIGVSLFMTALPASESALLLDLRAVQADTAGDGLDGGLGKTRFDGGTLSGFIGLDVHADLDVWQLDATLLRYPHSDKPVSLTEAFVGFRPLPSSIWRQQLRAGWFYLPMSLENAEATWQPRGFISSSSINTWLAEELRTAGLEWQLTRLGQQARSPHDVALFAAVFDHNDPAGSMLSWRGWAIHDRQFGWAEELDFAPLPTLSPTGSFRFQEPYNEPFTEIDHRMGYYAGVEWRLRPRWRLSFLHYDNRGEPFEVDDGQYAWATRFDHIGWRWQIDSDWTLQGQWLNGQTQMGRSATRFIDNDFSSQYVSLARQWHEHRFSARLEQFEVEDHDQTADDDNDETGHAVTLAWLWQWRERWQLLTELLLVDSERDARRYFNQSTQQQETVLQLAVRFHW